jgi:eukaryotic-like serine/threonine-protein kinase
MKLERWQQLDEIFHSALQRKSAERVAFLDQACVGDESLRKHVEALLCAHEEAGSFIEGPAMEVEARSIADDHVGLAAGQAIGHYRIISQLGAGGMGEVYLVHDTRLDRRVALKLLPADFTRDPDRVRRFRQEARSASALNHPNIITIYEIGEIDERHFIATEFIDGETLRYHIQSFQSQAAGGRSRTPGKPLQLRDILNVAIQTADALAAAHEAGIVHRDIKPENIMVRRRDGYVKVLDFGLAKLTEARAVAVDTEAQTRTQVRTSAGMVMGTASYMSPEQARAEKVDARTDIWSLGVVLYEMVAGCVPFERSTPSEVIALILEREPPPLPRYAREVPAELERIVSKTLTKDREERYQTAKDLLVDLRRLRHRLEIEAEIERTAQPEKSSEEKVVAASSEQTVSATARVATVETGDAEVARSTSSAAYLVEEIKLHKRGTLMILAVLVAATIAIAYLAYSHYAGGSRVGMIRSIAVLPFTNVSNNPDTEYLSDGVSESLINSLSQLPGVKVIARSSSFKYKGKEVDPLEVANALGVQGIVTGRIVQRGDDLQISVELMDARDKTQVWGDRYDRHGSDLLAVQTEISREIAEKLRLRLSNGEQQKLAKHESVNPQAYELLLRGRFYVRKGGPENRKKAIDYYQQAISVDPTYALAYAELSASYTILYSGGILDPKEFMPKAEVAVHRALELDDSLAEAHNALANLKQTAWDWAAAEREYQRAIELNPNLATAHLFYSFYLMDMGRYDEAIAEATRSRELDPLSLRANVQIGITLAAARRYDESIESLKKTLEMDQNFPPPHFQLGCIYTAKGMYREGIAEYEQAVKVGDNSLTTQIYLGAAYAKAGERAKAQVILDRLETSEQYVSPTELSILYVALGQREQAFASLEKAYAGHDLQLGTLGVDASFDSLREDPRFKDLMRRVGLLM